MSHKLSSVTISNYRSIIGYTFELSDYTPMIGYNNAGKTNIIRALKWLLRKSSLPVECFNDATQPIIVEGTIVGITADILETLAPNHRTTLTEYVRDGQLYIKRVQNNPGDGIAAIRLYLKKTDVEEGEEPWVPNPGGIDAAISNLFPDPIHIGAMENAEEDVSKSKTSSTIGKLLAEIIDPIEEIYGDRVKEALNGFQSLLDADGEARAEELALFDDNMNSKIDDFFPDVKVKLHIPTPELKEVFSKGTIRVYEEDALRGRDVASFGHGSQRAIQMALIRHLAELKQSTRRTGTCTLLLIDEPELYLHPQAIEVIKDALKDLSREGYQVVFSTHSALMLTHEDVQNAILVRKNSELGTYKRETVRSAARRIEEDAPSQLQLMFSLGNASNILFSERVILTEGSTEERILPLIMKQLLGSSLGILKCALVKQSGSHSTRKSMLVLHVMDIPCKAIVDLDYACKRSVTDGFLPDTDADVIGCKEVLHRLSTAHAFLLDENGWPRKGGTINAEGAFRLLAADEEGAVLVENLHNKLKEFKIWAWTKGSIEDHLGLPAKSEEAWANFIDRCNREQLEDVIPDYDGVLACATWLTS